MRPVRVLYLTHYAELYGANRSLLDLVTGSSRMGAVEPFVVLAADGPMAAALQRAGIGHAVVPFVPWMHKQVYSGRAHHRLLQRIRNRRAAHERDRVNEEASQRIIATAKEHRAQVVHTNSSVIGIGGPIARRLGVPHVWHIRELPFLHYHFRVDGGVRRYAWELKQADAIIALSQAVVEDMRQWLPAAERIHIVPNGIVTEQGWKERGSMITDRWARTGTFDFLLAGHFHPSKGQVEAIHAFAEVYRYEPATRLHLAGNGRMDPAREAVQQLGLNEVVHFHGYVERITDVMSGVHALLQCSQHEALGRIVLEARADGLPVIGHASGATPELVTDGANGSLYRTHAELVEAMRRMAHHRSEARRMGTVGRELVLEHYTLELMWHRIHSIYRDLCPS